MTPTSTHGRHGGRPDERTDPAVPDGPPGDPSDRGRSVGVVVPVRDGADPVEAVLDGLPAAVDRVYAVADRPGDDAWAALRAFERRANAGDGPDRFVAVRREATRDGGAVATGYALALADGVDVVAVLDGPTGPGSLARLLDPVVAGRADAATGTRPSGNARDDAGPSRGFGARLRDRLARVATGYRLPAPHRGPVAVSRAALAAVDGDALGGAGPARCRLLARLNAAEMRVEEVRLPPAREGAGAGPAGDPATADAGLPGPLGALALAALLLWTLLRRFRDRYLDERPRPAGLCLGLGGVAVATGLALAFAAAAGGGPLVVDGRPAVRAGLGVAFATGGLALLVAALAADAVASRRLAVRAE